MLVFFVGLGSCEVSFFEGSGGDFVMVGENNLDESSVFCGNGFCDEGESCGDCVRDCGSCFDGGGYVRFVRDSSVDEVNEVSSSFQDSNSFSYDFDSSGIFVNGAGLVSSIVLVLGGAGVYFVWRSEG